MIPDKNENAIGYIISSFETFLAANADKNNPKYFLDYELGFTFDGDWDLNRVILYF